MTNEKTPILELRNISKSYGSVEALTDVSFKAYAGEVIGLVGDNGAGKSTLIKTISGVHPADKGELLVDGQVRRWKSPHDSMVNGIETLYQDSGLAPDLTIGSNVFLGREVKPVIQRFLDGMPRRFEVAEGDVRLSGVVIEIDVQKATARKIELVTARRDA